MPRILIADDNSNIQKMVTLALEGAGIEVVSVSNGGAAIRILPETAPDLVLADVFMPVRSGYEVCEFIKHEPRFSHVPVVLLVGAFDPLDESEAQRVSADGILKKPFIPPEPLVNMVKALLMKALNERPEVPVAPNGHEVKEATATKASSAAPSEVAVEDFSDAPPEVLGPPQLEPDFGIHEETLAFGALLDIAVPLEAPSREPSPRFAEEDESESPRPPRENEFLGADFPELDQIAPPKDFLDEQLFANAPPHEEEMDVARSEPAVDFSPEFTEFVPHFSPELDSHPNDAAPEAPIASAETVAISWSTANGKPADMAPLAVLEASEAPAQDRTASVEDERAETTSESGQEAVDSGAADAAPAAVFSVPVFPGSERLWASVPGGSSEEKEAPKEAAEELKQEIPEVHLRAETEPLPWSVPEHTDRHTDESLAESAAFEELPAPAVTPGEPAEPATATAASEPFVGHEPVGDEMGGGEEIPIEDRLDLLGETKEDVSGDLSGASTAPGTEVATVVRQAAPDPELIEAVVSRIVERMQPKVIDVVTREILRPLVEALVRREINKA